MLGSVNVVMVPLVVIRSMELEPIVSLVNHSAPSGPAVISLSKPPVLKKVTMPAVVIHPIPVSGPLLFTNHSAPSGPLVMAPVSTTALLPLHLTQREDLAWRPWASSTRTARLSKGGR
jgi:hypothetical protein